VRDFARLELWICCEKLLLAKRKISIEIVSYVCCMQRMQHIFDRLNSEQKVIIVKDFNAHHSWWNAKISNSIRTKALINWVNLHKCNLINTSDINTYHSYLSQSSLILDLAFASKNMRKNWHINENADTEFDHEVILFTIVTKKVKLVENSLNASYNLQKVNWKDFDEHLQKTKDKIIVKMQRITSLEAKVIYLTECIKNTVKLFIFK